MGVIGERPGRHEISLNRSHPAVEETLNESILIQNHEIRFATVDLAATALEIREQLLRVLNGAG